MKTKIIELVEDLVRNNPETNGFGVYLKSRKYNLDFGYSAGINGYLDWKAPVNIASVTKMYVAAAVMRLVELKKLALNDPISVYLDYETKKGILSLNLNLEDIQIIHLLSNTSGIPDYVETSIYQEKTIKQPNYEWTREEQISLAFTNTSKRFQPGEQFEFSETNYLLLTLIIENCYKQPFEKAIRELLKFDLKKLNETWFIFQEEKPSQTFDFHLQTARSLGVDSFGLHPSFDAFGGGGMASTVKDMAYFGYELLHNGIFDSPKTLEQMLVEFPTKDGIVNNYGLGLMKSNTNEEWSFGHGGFWGTHLRVFPKLDLSVGVFVLERNAWMVYKEFFEKVSKLLKV